jgi:hypothetical protein
MMDSIDTISKLVNLILVPVMSLLIHIERRIARIESQIEMLREQRRENIHHMMHREQIERGRK